RRSICPDQQQPDPAGGGPWGRLGKAGTACSKECYIAFEEDEEERGKPAGAGSGHAGHLNGERGLTWVKRASSAFCATFSCEVAGAWVILGPVGWFREGCARSTRGGN